MTLPIKIDEHVHITFLLANLFSGLSNSNKDPWMHIHAADTTAASAHSSIRALAGAFFGRRHHSQEIIYEASKEYGKALKALNQDLITSAGRDRRSWYVTVLRSAMCLELYEV